MLVYLFIFVLFSSSQIQLYGFNKELYHNMSEAQHKAQGIVGISLMVQIGDTPNPELRIITSTFNKVLYKGKTTFSVIHALHLRPGSRLHVSLICECKFLLNF